MEIKHIENWVKNTYREIYRKYLQTIVATQIADVLNECDIFDDFEAIINWLNIYELRKLSILERFNLLPLRYKDIVVKLILRYNKSKINEWVIFESLNLWELRMIYDWFSEKQRYDCDELMRYWWYYFEWAVRTIKNRKD